MKYSNINDIASLDSAIAGIKKKLQSKKEEVSSSYVRAKEAYTPSSILASGLRSISSFIPFDKLALYLIAKVRRII